MPKSSLEETHYIIVSLKSIPRARIAEGMPDFHLKRKNTFASEHTAYNGDITRNTYVHIVDGLKSEVEFTTSFRALIDENGFSTTGG